MQLTGAEYAQLKKALVDGFTVDELAQMMREFLSTNLARVVSPEKNLDAVAHEVVAWSERKGLENDLIRGALSANQRSAGLVALAQSRGLAPRTFVDAALVEADGKVALDPQLERRVTDEPFLSVQPFVDGLVHVSRRVCRVSFRRPSGLSAQGTGYLLGPDRVLTCLHVVAPVVRGEIAPADVRCQFDFTRAANGAVASGLEVPLAESWNVVSSATADPTEFDREPTKLDYAVLALAPGQLDPARAQTVSASLPAPPTTGSTLAIVQHPDGDPMQLAIASQGVQSLLAGGVRMRHTVNTLPGSSGSPCFDLQWNWLGMHVSGGAQSNTAVVARAIVQDLQRQNHWPVR